VPPLAVVVTVRISPVHTQARYTAFHRTVHEQLLVRAEHLDHDKPRIK
jgi:hypothetical protein